MKKSPLFLSIVFLFLIMPLFAQMQSFEIYPFGGHSEPDITDISVIKVSSSLVKVTATITDISGVLSTGAIVKDSSGVERERGIMYDDGSHEDGSARDHIYSALFSIDSYPEGTFSVDLFAVDIFGNRADLTNVGEFLITPAATTETIELWTDKVESIWGYADHLNYKCLNYQDPYNTCFDDSRAQFIIPASELTNRGFKYGDKITSIYLKTSELPKLNLKNFRIRMKQIGSQIETASWEGGWTDLFGPTDILTTE
ncbi:hypothetical protein KJ786_01405, partial [Patescibacteria group bacterium]|nr:hypothetical protein [Patescibacteria group bacterium]